ncbi:nucleotide exchange factor GrpE [Phocaeicola coprophilus]|nr:nucleotide exchange factor GrpE [Phocaeicola coprophilus]
MNSTKDENMEKQEEKVTKQEEVNNHEEQSETPASEKTTEESKELSPEEKLQQSLDEAEKRIAEIQDKYLRLSAEFDNYRKRTIKEKSEIIKNAAEKTITAILPVLDDMERAIANMQKSEDAKAWLEGVELINNKFLKILSQEGLNKIETEGADFDTDYHEAIAMIPAPNEEQKGKVLDCVQTGYKLNDKVIRHAKVAVAQ